MTWTEHASALANGGVTVTSVEVFDIDGDGRIKCWEFIRTLGQIEGVLNGESGQLLPGHNTGLGGGGDPAGGTHREPAGD